MTALSAKRQKRTHRTYVKDWSGEIVHCTMIGTEDLAQLAESMDDLVIYQVGVNPLPASEISRITGPLRALAWRQGDLLSDRQELRKILVRQITDRLARLKLKTGRHVLAGVVLRIEGENERRILLLVVASDRVETCDFEFMGRQAA